MKTLKLKNRFQTNVTLITNDFIDHYMTHANGEFVKVYLFLLRHLNDPYSAITISTIADSLNNTESDILRAFRYWETEGLLVVERDSDDRIIGLELAKGSVANDTADFDMPASAAENSTSPAAFESELPTPAVTPLTAEDSWNSPVQEKVSRRTVKQPVVSKAIPLDSFKAQKELKSLLFIAEQYLGKTLSHNDVEAITYFYDTLGMSARLIEYLIESCVESGHKSMHYIQKVAISWVDDGITTVEAARHRSANYTKNCYTVLNAFGIKNRGAADSELAYIRKWTDDMGFTLDIVQEACRRTISATHQPSFEYADTILEKWYNSQVHHLKDIVALDTAFQKEKNSRKISSKPKTTAKNMNNFERRSYDMDSLEEQLLKSN